MHAFGEQNCGQPNWSKLEEGFTDNYFRSTELLGQDAVAMWQDAETSDERVEDYVESIGKTASRLELDESVQSNLILTTQV